jgi:hypothetical protein
VLDFGITKLTVEAGNGKTQGVFGTPACMSGCLPSRVVYGEDPGEALASRAVDVALPPRGVGPAPGVELGQHGRAARLRGKFGLGLAHRRDRVVASADCPQRPGLDRMDLAVRVCAGLRLVKDRQGVVDALDGARRLPGRQITARGRGRPIARSSFCAASGLRARAAMVSASIAIASWHRR